MIRSLRFVNRTVLLFLVMQLPVSCSPRISGESSIVPPAIELAKGESSQKYNIQLDFMKHHMSGMLIVRRMPDNEIRIVASTYFGLSLFDFSLQDGKFNVNSCIEPMKKEGTETSGDGLQTPVSKREKYPGEDVQRRFDGKKSQWKGLREICLIYHGRYSGRPGTNKNKASMDTIDNSPGQTI